MVSKYWTYYDEVDEPTFSFPKLNFTEFRDQINDNLGQLAIVILVWIFFYFILSRYYRTIFYSVLSTIMTYVIFSKSHYFQKFQFK